MADAEYRSGGIRRLTAAEIDAAKPRAQRYEISDGRSPLRLVVFPTGAKSWAVRYRVSGRQRKLTLGKYPAITLKDARLAASDTVSKAAQGIDLAGQKQRAKIDQAETVRALAARYIENWQKPRNRTWKAAEHSLNQALVRPLGPYLIRDVTRRDLIRVLEGKHRRTMACVQKFFRWTVEQGVLAASPADGIRCAAPINSRDRVLSDQEIRAFFAVLHELGDPWASMFELLILTGQRRGEVAGAVWSEIDLQERAWTLPKERVKNSRSHHVPLSRRAHEIVSTLSSKGKSNFLFPADRGGIGTASGFTRIKRRLDALMLEHLRKSSQLAELPNWTIHDLRRTAATGMAREGVPPHVVEAVLNHSSGRISGVAAIYNRFDYGKEKRAALEMWSAALGRIMDESP
ncbi:site-specific integrase [Hyphomonas sp.]|uniref:tyrosine-type recombinase/integrase n=1 Tax=Hyphomonas sp. TaxID=87 RepID=UPI001D5068AA|nr:site-specific integrase [Hyphomonas sp.]MBU3922021.1 tyrosine-type recombinase/integrase [Alphaproteobacteria bacterium]MBU4061133.1 tyrosine-type recombinase/integrase [Alphaproteobacteria bacterium]MBU4162857.1 tyrosine-type recombinase/integrase [Alphaproteobacteria bacterium]